MLINTISDSLGHEGTFLRVCNDILNASMLRRVIYNFKRLYWQNICHKQHLKMLIKYNMVHDKRFTGIKRIKIDVHLLNVFRVNI